MVQKTENVRKQTEVCDRWAPIIRNQCEAGGSARCGKAQNRLHTAVAASSGSLTGRRKANLNFYKRSFQLLFNWLSGPDTRTFPSALSLRKLEGDLYFEPQVLRLWCVAPGSFMSQPLTISGKSSGLTQDCTNAVRGHWKLVIHIAVLYNVGHIYQAMG